MPGGSENEIIDALTQRERSWMIEWARSCPHTASVSATLARYDEGSEHTVFLAPDGVDVIKRTLPGTFGDLYFVNAEGRVCQRCCTPAGYLVRLAMLEINFGFAPRVVGVTGTGQIVTAQRFVEGDPATQDEVDEFLRRSGFEAVKRNCWLWKKSRAGHDVEYWVGDARADNFIKTRSGLVPIDLRMWSLPMPAG